MPVVRGTVVQKFEEFDICLRQVYRNVLDKGANRENLHRNILHNTNTFENRKKYDDDI